MSRPVCPGPQDFVSAASWGLSAAADHRLRGAIAHTGHRPPGANPHWPVRPGPPHERGGAGGVSRARVFNLERGWGLELDSFKLQKREQGRGSLVLLVHLGLAFQRAKSSWPVLTRSGQAAEPCGCTPKFCVK